MSYLVDVVGSVEPSRIGEIALDLNDLSDVSTSPATNEFLYYNGSSWIASTGPSEFKDVASFAQATSIAESIYTPLYYSTAYEAPFLLAIRAVSASGAIVAASNLSGLAITLKYFGSSSAYMERITISANTNALLAQDMCIAENSDAIAYIDVQWQTSTGTALGPIVRVRRTGYNRQTIYGYISTSGSSVDVGLKTIAISGNVAWPQSTATKNQYNLTAKFTA